MGDDLELPDEIYGFGSWLLWLIATRATALADRVFAAGPARPSRAYGMADGHHVPTPSLIAWLLTAAEFEVPVEKLSTRDPAMDERQKVLRTLVSRAITADPRVFKDDWLADLARLCGLSRPELDLLLASRSDGNSPVEPAQLRRAVERTLRSRARLAATAQPALAATQTLPRDIAAFVGREAELARLSEAAAIAAATGALVSVYAVDGMAGVGKTAFAIHAAHLLAARFPDGQLFLSMHAHTAGQAPVEPADALAGLLLTLGVGSGQIPPGIEPRSRLWRDRLAGRRVLLVLDDVTGHEQVRPLLPGTPGSLVIVTSRRRLLALEDTSSISLESLTPDEACALLVRLIDRPEISPQQVADLARQSGYLPLAIGMLGRQLHHHPGWSPAYLAANLTAARDRLALMTAENLSVAAAFDLSYQDLAPRQQRLFRRLGLHPGTDVDAWSAAALDGTSAEVAGQGLNLLYDCHLLIETAPGRFRFHDLIRQHARTLAAGDPAADCQAAVGRLLDYYVRAACAANGQLARRPGELTDVLDEAAGAAGAAGDEIEAALPDLTTAGNALAWMRSERHSLAAAARYAAEHGRLGPAIVIPAAMHAFLHTSGDWDAGVRMHAIALDTAVRIGEPRAQARALTDLGVIQRSLADLQAAAASQARALDIFREQADDAGVADALFQLGSVQTLTDETQAAPASLSEALRLYRGLGNHLGAADALTSLGYVHYRGDDFAAADACLTEALALYRNEGDRSGELGALNYLAHVQQQIGEQQAARASLTAAFELCLAIGDRNAEAAVRTNLGSIECTAGSYDAAAAHLTRALELNRELGNRLGQANSLNYLGLARRLAGDAQAAISCQHEAIDLYRACGSGLGEANALQELGSALQQAGEFDAAMASQEAALDLYRGIDEAVGQAETLNNIGGLLLASGRSGESAPYHEQALAITREVMAPLERARALEGIGQSFLLNDKSGEAVRYLSEALEIYRQIGSPNADRVSQSLKGRPGDC